MTKKDIHVLVLEGSKSAALQIVRSLGVKGIRITVGHHYRISPGLYSRYAHKRIYYPSPEEDRNYFLDFLERHQEENSYDLVFPVSDFTVIPIVENRERFAKLGRVAIPPQDQIMAVQDKAKTIRAAQACGCPHPCTFIPNSLEEVREKARQLSYPVIVKARSKVSWIGTTAYVNKVTDRNYVDNAEDLVRVYEDVHRTSPLPLVQERISGPGVGFFALMAHGEPKAVFAHRRVREYPISGGASSCRESFYDPPLEELGIRILKALKWDGVAMVEFKRDIRDGGYKLIEINGRWWGSLALPLAAGVDFPMLYTRYLLEGTTPQAPPPYRQGVRCRAIIPLDLLWLFSRLKQPRRWRALWEFFRPDGSIDDVFSWDDPWPTLGSVGLMLNYALEIARGRLTLSGEKK